MTLIINDFEVVAEPPKSEPRASPAQEAKPAPATPQDIDRILRLQKERTERVRAH